MTLFSRFKARFMHPANCPSPAQVVASPNAAPVVPAQRVRGVARMVRQIDGASVALPPVQSRYSGQRRDIKALNRNGWPPARRGSTRSAVGL
ncbi:hypothetical protein ACH4T9_12300 [Micromonospora sp. NPDC020750]|uniref:hypothetical protein n=1 Tax=unclassified Micromonospora TaxID=2617518 RepID=UPI0037AB309C